IRLMQKLGTHGVGQSSWGPTFYGLCQNEKEGKRVQLEVQTYLKEGVGGQVFIAKANNKGANIKVGAKI
ncbi:MAG: beta-ribofuranosylaminobenzene 5'-phosphate synthase, partial [Candidatus Bathyarchaeota archaeon]